MGVVPHFEFNEKDGHFQMWYEDDYIGSFSNVCYTKQYFRVGKERWFVHVMSETYFVVVYQEKYWFFSLQGNHAVLMTNNWLNWFCYIRDNREVWGFIILVLGCLSWFILLNPFVLMTNWCIAKEYVKFLFSCDFGSYYKTDYQSCFVL